MRTLVLAGVAVGMLASLAVGVMVAGDKPQPKAAPSDKDKLQGTWQMVSGEGEGMKEPAEFCKHFTYTFKGDGLRFRGDETTPGADLEFSYTLDPKKTPKEIDLKLTKVPDNKGVRSVSKGIYSLQGEELKLCYSDEERPTKFETKPKDRTSLVVLKRKK
jgi:uncharacterized protein (TIGR03067 family)